MNAVRFLFGSGWQVLWYLAFWLSSLLFVGLPMKQFWDYVREGKDAGPAAMATFAVLMMAVLWAAVVTLVSSAMFVPALAASGWVKLLVVLAAASLAGVAPLLAGYSLAQRPSWVMYGLTFGPVVAIAAVNLVLMHLGRAWPAGSVPLRPGPAGWVALAVLASPALLTIALSAVTAIVAVLQLLFWNKPTP